MQRSTLHHTEIGVLMEVIGSRGDLPRGIGRFLSDAEFATQPGSSTADVPHSRRGTASVTSTEAVIRKGYELGRTVDSTSRVVIYDGERLGPRGFRRDVTLLALRRDVMLREPFAARDFVEAAGHFARIDHPGVAVVEDVWDDGEARPCAVTARLRGRSLRHVLDIPVARAQPLAVDAAFRLVEAVADAAHAAATGIGSALGGIVAEAIWVDDSGRASLLPSARVGFTSAFALRRPRHVPPEVARSASFEPTADVYALGLLLWDLLILGRARVPLRLSDVTHQVRLPFEASVVRLVMQALSPDPASRARNAAVFRDALSSLRAHASDPVIDVVLAPSVAPSVAPSLSPLEQIEGTIELDGRDLLPVAEPALSVMPSPRRRAGEPALVCDETVEGVTLAEVPRGTAKLNVIRGGTSHALMLGQAARRWVVGRAGSADLALSDPEVSRQHFEIVREASGIYRVHDLDSKNGLFVNGAPVEKSLLRSGDVVRAGDTVLRFDT
jgi:hypothetical protein